ncbi:uncharacterized protein A4U43_C02F21070 [Asparagus officinalis]|uniref:Uncharacterized protein n=1 Tax=Asparagus officinalis TaxID=4686 RepID=A0A5P1FJW3_ASPOF|nr:uncharacterized protein A4U43_C02F21070 [Asparagus officinalis]
MSASKAGGMSEAKRVVGRAEEEEEGRGMQGGGRPGCLSRLMGTSATRWLVDEGGGGVSAPAGFCGSGVALPSARASQKALWVMKLSLLHRFSARIRA